LVLASQVSTTSKPKWRLSQLENFHCSHRRPAGLSFPGLYFSLNQHSIETQFSQHPRLPRVAQLPPQFSSRTTSWRHPSVKPNQGGSEPRLRRSSVGGYHTHSDELLLSPFFFFFFFFKLPFPFFAIRLLRYLSVGRFSNSCSLFLCLSVMRRGSGALSPATHAHSTSHSQTYTTTFIHPWAPFPTELEPVLTSRWWPKEC
jgi:hypothetical protein